MSRRNPFMLKKPCANCPFRIDRPFYLTEGRVEEIAEGQKNGEVFYCHKTLNYTPLDETDGVEDLDDIGDMIRLGVINDVTQVCMGSLITQIKGDGLLRPGQVAASMGIFDPEKVDLDSPVADGLDAWAEHQKGIMRELGLPRTRPTDQPGN